jgi:hypothetical protein
MYLIRANSTSHTIKAYKDFNYKATNLKLTRINSLHTTQHHYHTDIGNMPAILAI